MRRKRNNETVRVRGDLTSRQWGRVPRISKKCKRPENMRLVAQGKLMVSVALC